ncbi:MAG TPA: hypothetical protein VHE37_14445, partial [Nevskiaceae bacterium]|nr:hypothetical protein [Nevskiaceae bacterium]
MNQPRPRSLTADASAWLPFTSGPARLSLCGHRGALQMDFDLAQTQGFVVARRPCTMKLPDDFVVRLRARGAGGRNHLELKLVDGAGTSVWRCVWRDLRPSPRWKRLGADAGMFIFAWGPRGGGPIADVSAIEIAVVAGAGGAGRIDIDELEILPRATRPWLAAASSAQAGHQAAAVSTTAGWKPAVADTAPWLELDGGGLRPAASWMIEWTGAPPDSGLRVRLDRGRGWSKGFAVPAPVGERSYLLLPAGKVRRIRLELPPRCAGLRLRELPASCARSPEDLWHAIAAMEPRGLLPRWLLREQSLWTPVGRVAGGGCALMSEQGMVEIAPGSCSLEPMLRVDGQLRSWADAAVTQDLSEHWQPLPKVTWQLPGLVLEISAQPAAGGALALRYRLKNSAAAAARVQLLLLLRPLQVTPEWQKSGSHGGVAPVHRLQWRAGRLRVDERIELAPATRPDRYQAWTLAQGVLPSAVAAPQPAAARDRHGSLSASLLYQLTLEPGASAECVVDCASLAAAPA